MINNKKLKTAIDIITSIIFLSIIYSQFVYTINAI